MKLVLSIDGGGARITFVQHYLALLEKKLGRKLNQVFDLVIGVSAGAILGAEIAVGEYERLDGIFIDYDKIFDGKQQGSPLFTSYYSGRGKTAELKKHFGNRKLSQTQTVFGALLLDANGKIKVYNSEHSTAKNYYLWEVLDATSAALMYFPPVEIAGEFFVDAGMFVNDPSLVAIPFGKCLWSNDELYILSLGTGDAPMNKPTFTDLQSFGVIRILGEGFLNFMNKSHLDRRHIPIELGKGHYVRINSQLQANMDDHSQSTQRELIIEAREAWRQTASDVVEWLARILSRKKIERK